jgi:hypothetical protein
VDIGPGPWLWSNSIPPLGTSSAACGPVLSCDAEVIGDEQFPRVCVVPVTGTSGEGLLYPELAPGESSIAKQSFAWIDHLRSLDKPLSPKRLRRTGATRGDAVWVWSHFSVSDHGCRVQVRQQPSNARDARLRIIPDRDRLHVPSIGGTHLRLRFPSHRLFDVVQG